MLNPVLADIGSDGSGGTIEEDVATLKTQMAAAQNSLNTVSADTIEGGTLIQNSDGVTSAVQLQTAGATAVNLTVTTE